MSSVGKIFVDKDLCIGAGECIIASGDVFEFNNENKAVMKVKGGGKTFGPIQKDELEADTVDDAFLFKAAEECPVKAIFLYDSDGKQLYPSQ